jgi:hypothetical protein
LIDLPRILVLSFLVAACTPAHADWFGEGVVFGEVIDSGRRGNVLTLRATIIRQEIAAGPRLGSPCTFAYEGPVKIQISPGDLVRLQVNGSNGPITIERIERISNSRPLECVSSWSPHFDSDSMIRHPPQAEREMGEGLPEHERAPSRLSATALGSWPRTANATRVQRLSERHVRPLMAMSAYDEFSNTGFCGAMPRIRAVSNSAIESNRRVRK